MTRKKITKERGQGQGQQGASASRATQTRRVVLTPEFEKAVEQEADRLTRVLLDGLEFDIDDFLAI